MTLWREYVVIIQALPDVAANHVSEQENYNKCKLMQLAYKFSTLQSPTPHSLGALLEVQIKSYEMTCKWKTIHWSCQKNPEIRTRQTIKSESKDSENLPTA